MRIPDDVRRIAVGVVLALGALTTVGCADGTATRSVEPRLAMTRETVGGQTSMREGALYVAELHPLNARVQQALDPDGRTPRGVVSGKAYFRVVGGVLRAEVHVAGAEPTDGKPFPEGLHAQHIHEATRCPPQSADANRDGVVDVIEGVPFYGAIMVPLDGDISNTTSEIPTFPLARGDRGTYDYTASASVATLEAALGHGLDLPSRHVVVHGVDLDTPLPPTVQSLGGLPAQVTLPVACGEIHEVR